MQHQLASNLMPHSRVRSQAYADLKKVRTDEIIAGQDQIDKKTQEMATTDEQLAESKEDLKDTKNTLAGDEES